MDYTLKKPLDVYVKTETSGSYEQHDIVTVSFTGKKGLKAIKRLQDVIMKTFSESASESDNKSQQKKKATIVTVDEVLDMVEMTGSSERLFDEVTGAMKAFATIGGTKLVEDLQDAMHMDDLDGLFQEVLKHFLLPKIIQKMNNLNK